MEQALDALGRARALDRERSAHHLSFATALVRAGQYGAARQVLLGLRQAHPENPDINLGLAEIEARAGAPDDAVRFYQRALFGDWPADRIGQRERVRIEMIEYLLAVGERARASAQLGLLAADLPVADPARRTEAARLFLEAGDPVRALEVVAPAIEAAPRDAAALRTAGDAAFARGDVEAARGYYARLPADAGASDAAALADRRELVARILASDPFARDLTPRARARRLARGHAVAAALIDGCGRRLAGGSAEAEQLSALEGETAALGAALAGPQASGADADAVAVIGAVVSFASQHCAPLDIDARAWMFIQQHAREGQR
jgi:thioredoxin-like negative regulator of GroEL